MFDVDALREIADDLSEEESSEAHVRSAINRYYYYCHLAVRRVNRRLGIAEFQGNRTDHGTAVQVLHALGLDTHGDMLNELQDIRGSADYELLYEPSGRDIRMAQQLAEQLKRSIEEQGFD